MTADVRIENVRREWYTDNVWKTIQIHTGYRLFRGQSFIRWGRLIPAKYRPVHEEDRKMKKTIALLTTLCIVVTLAVPLTATGAARPVGYMPGVTEEMTDAAFWSGLTDDPDALLATAEDIARINEAAESAEGTNRRNMRNLQETYDGVARNEALQKSAADDAEYYLGWVWDQTGKKMEQEDFDAIIANCADPDAKEEMPLRYGIAVNRTELITFPWDGQILDDPADIDFDYQPLVGIRVNEPVAVYSTSADGKYYQVATSCCTGWTRVEDIALCRDKDEWLSAWDIPAEKRLVLWGDKMYTDYSNSASQTVCRLITMGTVLERMEEADPDALVINRLPLHNYAVYLPVKNEDGSYGKTPALINARERVSEDYLPLTAGNLATVALTSLGDAYGWGAGLNNEDCTSLNHSIFCCFGLDLPRNGTWQWLMDFPKAEIGNYTLEEKEALLDTLPMGTLLNFPGHQMMYLGKTAGNYYVVSTVSSLMSPWSGKRGRTRDVQINTLDIRRANGRTWMQALNKVYIPWLYLNEGEEYAFPELPAYHEYTAFCLEKGLVDPYSTGYFLPLRASTVTEAVVMMWRIAGKPEPEETAEKYEDVAAGSAEEKAAFWARQTGVYTGTDGKFRGSASLTWGSLAAMTRNLLNGDVTWEIPAEDTVVTRAELAGIGQAAFTEWEAQHAEGNSLAGIRERGVLRVGTAGDYQPMSFLDPDTGTYVGFDAELAEDLAASLGVTVEYVPSSWPTLMEDTLAGKFDLAICGITVTDARKEQALMSEGYLSNGKTVLCRAEDADKYTSLEAINRPEVRVMENPGGLNEKYARDNLPDATLIIHEVNQEIPGLVASGEADVMITETMEAGYYVGQDSRLAAPLIFEPFTTGDLGVLMPRGSEDLLEYVNVFLAEEKASGRIDELAEQYIFRYIRTEQELVPAA